MNAISAAYRKDTTDILLAKALPFVRDGQGETPVTAEWTDWLSTLRPTSESSSQSGHLVSKVAISSGQWLVIFTDTATLSSIMAQSIHGLFWFIKRSNLSLGRPTSSDNSLTMPS